MNIRGRRTVRVVLGAGIAVAALLAGAMPASASSVSPRPQPSAFNFSDCPSLPPGLDRHAWRCEVHLATAEMTVGRVTITGLTLRLTHAEGPLPDGQSGQIFGALRARPVAVPGDGAADGQTGVTLDLKYAGYADLIGNGPDPGGLYLMLSVRGPNSGPDCAIGSTADPIKIHAVRVGDTYTIPTDPSIRVFTMQDNAFTVPGSSGCGSLASFVNQRFGLPSVADNALTLHAAYTYRMYDSLD
jgi:hypothetical protein